MPAPIQLTIDEKKKTVTVVMPLNPRNSASGKSLVIAGTTGGAQVMADAVYNGKPVRLTVSAYVPADKE